MADEPPRLVEDDFGEDRLAALDHMPVEREEIRLGRAAEVLGMDLLAMQELANAWMR